MFLSHTSQLENNSLSLNYFNGVKRLVKDQGYKVFQNVCPHQHSRLDFKNDRFVCPYHSWTFDNQGNPLGSGTTNCKNKKNLECQKVYNYGEFIFSNKIPLIGLDFLNFNYELKEFRVDTVKSAKEIIMDVFLDVDHIPTVHRGLYDTIGLDKKPEIEWTFFDKGSLQLAKTNGPSKITDKDDLRYGAAWLALYPETMIEWQPGALFVTVTKTVEKHSEVYVWKFKDIRYSEEDWTINESIWETAWTQDKQQSENIVYFSELDNDLEEAKKHFRRFI